LVEILNCYGVRLSPALQIKLDNHLVLPEKDSTSNTGDLQQKICQLNELEPEMRLRKSLTLKALLEIVDEFQTFLKPVEEQLEFLCYFHLHHCEMFSRHLNSHIAKISAQSVELSTSTLSLPSVSTQQPLYDPDKKLQQVINVILL